MASEYVCEYSEWGGGGCRYKEVSGPEFQESSSVFSTEVIVVTSLVALALALMYARSRASK